MTKPIARPCSPYSRDALQLLGQLVLEGRLARAFTTTELATRAGISRALLQRIEKGDPGCSIGSVFETAAICGVPLFESDKRLLAATLERHSEKNGLAAEGGEGRNQAWSGPNAFAMHRLMPQGVAY